MPDLWNDLAQARAAARTSEQARETVLASLASVHDRLGVLALEVAALPARIEDANAAHDEASAALAAATAALAQAQAAAGAAAAAVAAAQQDVQAKQAALTAAQSRLEDLQGELADLLADDDLGPDGKPIPGRAARIASLRKQIAAQQNVVDAATAAVAAATSASQAAGSAAAQAAAATEQAFALAAAAQAAADAAAATLAQLQAALDQAAIDRPVLTDQVAALEVQAASTAGEVATAWERHDTLLDAWLTDVTAARRALGEAADAAVTARTAGADVAAADAAAGRARADLDAQRSRALGGDDPAAVIEAVRTDVPLALLPVRLETAFLDAAGGTEVAVRVYPDTASIDGNLAQLSASERELGAGAAAEIAAGDAERARTAFDRLAAAAGAGRAAWILRVLASGERGLRPDGWRPPPTVRLLPDRWVAMGYAAGTRIVTRWGEPIPPDLPVLDGAGGPDGLSSTQRGWATDLDAAVGVGMAIRMPLSEEQVAVLDTIVVVGVAASIAPDAQAEDLAELLHAHRCSGGLALPAAGAATNALGTRRTGSVIAVRGRPDADLELGDPVITAGDVSDGDRLTVALGLTATDGPLARVAGADSAWQSRAAHASALMWPVSWGYFLDHMLPGVVADAAHEQARRHAVDHVRGRGVLPLMQIGAQPYGVLPVTSLTRFVPATGDALEASLADVLRELRDRVWLPAAARVPRLDPALTADGTGGTEASTALAAVLRHSGRSVGLRTRGLFGGEYAWNLANFLAQTPIDPAAWNEQTARAHGLATVLRLPPGRIADAAFATQAAPVALPLADSSQDGLSAHVSFLLAHGWRELRDASPPASSVFALLLRHAALRSYADAAAALLGLPAQERADAELVAVSEPQETTWDHLERALPDGRIVGDVLDARRTAGPAAGDPELPAFDGVWAALAALSELDPGAWEDLLAETLDTASHRLDAWVTSLAARTLVRIRADRPAGIAVGGYGWVTDLRPSAARRLAIEEGRLVAARDAAAAELEALRGRSAEAVAVRAAADSELAAARGALAEAQRRVDDLQQLLTQLEDDLADALDGEDPVDPHEPVPKPKPGIAALRRRIAETRTALESAQTALPPAAARVDAATAARASTQQAQDGATAAESAAAIRLGAAEDALTALRAKLGQARAGTEEFVHAPSLQQASTAAVLRSGYLADPAGGASAGEAPFSIDLSSARMRRAAHVVEGARAGQPPTALLGYQLERDLHDRGLSTLVMALRTLCPYGELTAAEVRAADLHRAADAAAQTLQTLNGQHTDAEVAAAIAAEARRRASADLTAARDADQAAQAAIAAAQSALTAANRRLIELSAAAEASRRRHNIPPWKQPSEISEPEVTAAEEAAAAQKAVVADRRAELVAAQSQAATAAAARAAAQTADDRAANAVVTADSAVTDLQNQIDALSPVAAALQDDASAADASVERLRETLRDQAVEAAAASSVVDGLAVLERYRTGRDRGVWDATTLPLGAPGSTLPAVGSADGEQLLAALASLAGAVDAVADAATAEAVHQLVQGNPERASAAADAIAQFDLPPELEVARTPRTGSAFTQRVAVLGAAMLSAGPDDGWPADPGAGSPRAAAEPVLERWLRGRLPDPRAVRARVEWADADAQTTAAMSERTLAELGLSALDVVYGTSGDHGDVTDRLLHTMDRERPADVPEDAVPRLAAGRAQEWGPDVVGWSEMLVVAGALREVLAGARPCDARDLTAPGATDPGVDLAQLADRADTAAEALDAAHQGLSTLATGGAPDSETLRRALLAAAALGVPGAVPQPAAGDAIERWSDQVGAAMAELQRRRAALLAAEAEYERAHPDPAALSPAEDLAHQLARLALVFGDGFRALPWVRVLDAGELTAALAAANGLTGGKPEAVWAWLRRAAHVRADIGRLAGALTLAEAVGANATAALDVVQLPHGAHDRWLALAGARPSGGELSLVLATDAPILAASPVAGFVVDEWNETVPDPMVTTGVAMRTDRPRAQAPQSVLLAVAPTAQHVWDLDTLEAVVLETLELARLRAVDLEALDDAGSAIRQYLPAAYVAANTAGATVSTIVPALTAATDS